MRHEDVEVRLEHRHGAADHFFVGGFGRADFFAEDLAQMRREFRTGPAVVDVAALLGLPRQKRHDVLAELFALGLHGLGVRVVGGIALDPGVLHVRDAELLQDDEDVVLVGEVGLQSRSEFLVRFLVGHGSFAVNQ